MKLFSILVLSLVLSKGCTDDQQQTMESATIEYVAKTRGFSQSIIINNKAYTFSRNVRGKDTLVQGTIADTDWNNLILAFQEVSLDDLPNVKAPTEKRFYDGAAIAQLKIIYKDKSYESNTFDHGFPPQEIEKLVNKINSFTPAE
jgi:hypothetical protein